MSLNVVNENDPRVMFLGDIEEGSLEDLSHELKNNPQCTIVLSILTSCQKHDRDDLLDAGFEEIDTEYSKFESARQRELENDYLKLYVLNVHEYAPDKNREMRNRIKNLREQEGYEFLNWPKEYFLTYGRSPLSRFEIPRNVVGSSYYPFVEGPSLGDIQKVRDIHLRLVGFVVPDACPFTGNKIRSLVNLRSMLNFLMYGVHEDV